MICSNCKKETPNDSYFCEFCGHAMSPIRNEETENVSQQRLPQNVMSTDKSSPEPGPPLNLEVESKYASLKVVCGIIKMLAIFAPILFITSMHGLMMNVYGYYEGGSVVVIILIGVLIGVMIMSYANKLEIMMSLEESNRINNLLLKALYDLQRKQNYRN